MYVLNTSRYLSTSNENISLCSAAASSYAMRCDAMRCMGSQKMCDRQHSSETHSLNKLSAATNRHDEYANWRHIWREKTSSGLSLSSSSLNCASFVKAKTIAEMSSLAELLGSVDHLSLNDKNRVVCSITGKNDVHDTPYIRRCIRMRICSFY